LIIVANNRLSGGQQIAIALAVTDLEIRASDRKDRPQIALT